MASRGSRGPRLPNLEEYAFLLVEVFFGVRLNAIMASALLHGHARPVPQRDILTMKGNFTSRVAINAVFTAAFEFFDTKQAGALELDLRGRPVARKGERARLVHMPEEVRREAPRRRDVPHEAALVIQPINGVVGQEQRRASLFNPPRGVPAARLIKLSNIQIQLLLVVVLGQLKKARIQPDDAQALAVPLNYRGKVTWENSAHYGEAA